MKSHTSGFMRAGIAVAVLTALGWLGGCSDTPNGPVDDRVLEGLIVSDPVKPAGIAPGARIALALAGSAADEVAYVSLPPGTVPTGHTAIIRRVGDVGSIFTTVFGGGFDPVPVGAQAGDSVEVRVTDAGGATLFQARRAVADGRAPVVVRTSPPRGKTDVAVNASIVIVFSEPVAAGSLTSSSVQLFRGTTRVAGAVSLLQGTGAAIAFTPVTPLDRSTGYRVVVTRAVRDLDGDALAAGLTVAFTTGQSSTGPAASVTLSPDTLYLTGATYQMTATVRDAAGNELIDQPITWSTSDPNGLAVTQTGVLTALAAGQYYVTVTTNGLTAVAVVSVSAGPAASVTVSPTQATVGAAGDTITLVATVQDASRHPLDHPSVTWTSSDPAVATVARDSSSRLGRAFATVTGVNLGTVTISATIGTAAGTTSVTVTSPPPVASVKIIPESATLFARTTTQLSAAVQAANGKVLAGRLVTWTTDNAAVATVDAKGLVTGVSEGAAAVIATSEGVSDTAAITVKAPVPVASVTGAAGLNHTCGLTSAGAAYCWGWNRDGELGNGSTTNSPTPVAVSGGLSFSALAAGGVHTCGLTSAGAAYCWGSNLFGQLGDPSTRQFSSTPVAVSGGLSFSALAAGWEHSCGLTSAGTAYCWGSGYSSTPVAVSGGLSFSSLTAGSGHTCGLTSAGAAYCWGENGNGQLGDGSTANSSAPVAVSGGLTFSALDAGGAHTCGLTSAGTAYCWGWNRDGELGNGSTTNSPTPVAVSGGLSFSALAAGWTGHTCGLTSSGAAYCWGRNDRGQLGDGSTASSATPVAVSGGLSFSALAAGGAHTCGLTSAGAAYCWGDYYYGQVGNGDSWTLYRNRPGAVSGGLNFGSLAAGWEHNCGVTTAGAAYCWGYNGNGQLGNGSTGSDASSSTPVAVSGGLSFSSLVAGSGHSCGLTSAGVTYCWGANGAGQLGDGSTANSVTPVTVSGGLSFSALAAGGAHTCGLTSVGAAYCWGDNHFGQVGNGSTTNSSIPVAVSGGLSFSAITAGQYHTCGLTSAGAAYCWGWNRDGELGNGSTTDSPIPVPVSWGLSFRALAAGWNHTCGLASGGQAYCWGVWWGGAYAIPAPTFNALAAGYEHDCGLTSAGAAYCWGDNGSGQLGDGSFTNGYPVAVSGGLSFSIVAAGYYDTCGLTTAGAAYCWGGNSWGSLGDGVLGYVTVPVAVAPFTQAP